MNILEKSLFLGYAAQKKEGLSMELVGRSATQAELDDFACPFRERDSGIDWTPELIRDMIEKGAESFPDLFAEKDREAGCD